MSDRPDHRLSASVLLEIEKLCDRFERQWKVGKQPRIEELLGRVAKTARSCLLYDLIRLEIELRQSECHSIPVLASYLQRFPSHDNVVRAAYHNAPTDLRFSVPAQVGTSISTHPDRANDNDGSRSPEESATPCRDRSGSPVRAEVELQVVTGQHSGKKFLFTDQQTFVVGRARDAQLRVSNDGRISRYQCRFAIHPPDCRVIDLDSTNGTFVNGSRVQNAVLLDGDRVGCGDTEIRVAIPQSAELETVSYPASPKTDIGKSVDPCSQRKNFEGINEISGYNLRNELGRGGMGLVYHAVHRVTKREAAVKLIVPKTAAADSALQLFLREVSILSQLRHRRIVELLEFGLHEKCPYLVMEYIPTVSLSDLLSRSTFADRIRIASGVMCRVLEALQVAHDRDIVHRDVKPPNILVFRDDGKLNAKLSDFGIAKNYMNAGFSAITNENETRGTLAFMPPEQLISCRYSKPSCDIFAAGASLYFFLTGKTVFPLEDASGPITTILQKDPIPIAEREQRVPAQLATVIDTAVARDAEARFSSATQMRKALVPFSRRR